MRGYTYSYTFPCKYRFSTRVKMAWRLLRGSLTIELPGSFALRDYLDGTANTPRTEMPQWREVFDKSLKHRHPLQMSEIA